MFAVVQDPNKDIRESTVSADPAVLLKHVSTLLQY